MENELIAKGISLLQRYQYATEPEKSALKAEISELTKQLGSLPQPDIKPQRIAVPNYDQLETLCQGYIDSLGTDKEREGARGYIYEEALMAIYGRNIFDYINKKAQF
jgi:hypothetical protein